MKKRLTAMLMALIIVVSLLPMPVMAASEEQEAQIEAAVSKVVTDYAKKVYRPNADDEAFNAYFKHGFYGNGKDMHLTESSAMVSSMFNSCLMQDYLTNSISIAITQMQELRMDEMYLHASIGWHNFYYDYFSYSYQGNTRDHSKFVGTVCTTKELYGNGQYDGPSNENDEVMELLVGGMSHYIIVKKVGCTQDTVSYEAKIVLDDDFDFEGSYSDVADKGYDTSTDDKLKDLGLLFTFMGLDEFNWYYTKTLEFTVPNLCDHEAANYHWSYDAANSVFYCDKGSGFTANEAVKCTAKVTSQGNTTEKIYFKLNTPVVLRCDRPWVVEYEQTGRESLWMSYADSNNGTPGIYSYLDSDVWFRYVREVLLPAGETTSTGANYISQTAYIGVHTKGNYPHNSAHTYTHILENVISPDGSNMIYLSIYDQDLGEVVFGPEPMDDYRGYDSKTQTYVVESTESDFMNGRDVVINFIGNKSVDFGGRQTALDLRIWENGKEPAEDAGTYIAPTCTEQGGVQRQCIDCGCDYFTDVEAALGHSYTEYTDDGNGSCTEVGTKTRSCTRCGITETVPAEGGAVGHAFGEFVPDNNTTCTHVGTETRTCARCGLTETRNLEGSAAGHDFGAYAYDHNATCTEDGTMTAVCKSCGAKDTVPAEGSATGHSYEAAVTEPTCTEKGYTTYTCVCGDSYVGDETAPADHAWDAGIVTVQPTLTTPGTVKYTCNLCGETKHMSTEAVKDTGFEDVSADAYYANAVVWAKGAGVTSGLSETLFGSDMSCTRGQVVTFLWAAAGKPEPAKSENPFTDVSEADYYYKPVLWAVEQGITGGIGEGQFGPDQSCTRGQIVTFLWRAKNSPETGSGNPFTDVAETDYYFNSVLWASENAITGGIGEGLFGPNNTCTRAQVVTFLYKTYQ